MTAKKKRRRRCINCNRLRAPHLVKKEDSDWTCRNWNECELSLWSDYPFVIAKKDCDRLIYLPSRDYPSERWTTDLVFARRYKTLTRALKVRNELNAQHNETAVFRVTDKNEVIEELGSKLVVHVAIYEQDFKNKLCFEYDGETYIIVKHDGTSFLTCKTIHDVPESYMVDLLKWELCHNTVRLSALLSALQLHPGLPVLAIAVAIAVYQWNWTSLVDLNNIFNAIDAKVHELCNGDIKRFVLDQDMLIPDYWK